MSDHLTPEIIGLVTTVVVGVIIRVIDHYLPSAKARAIYDGVVKVIEKPDRTTYALEYAGDPAEIAGKDEVHLRIDHSTEDGP